ncbi:beta-lactamase/transpeptidase-like protein [Hypoxylon trugodes]|uniref:beta-lactamase/transpeptidase-like protein n=1 Tax=Hypoxylon trugodes TaxID=326681 RepID=UPI00219381FE|nr:beta-lactamase/transpeptidase-like protein [Hypoxylon trugodes]KAI1389324.1 beta-lactamase/transpeptidase-like protein [Hypoxylon trugodes]
MAEKIDKIYEDAIAAGLLPGASVFAGDKDGNILYSKSFGKASLKEGKNEPFTESTIASIASMTKIMTSVAALQCVEDGTLGLDKDLKPLLPDIGKQGVVTGFDDEKNDVILEPVSTPYTLRLLLTHTSGYEYDWFNPHLTKWRASRGEALWFGKTVEEKAALPVFQPGTGFAYGTGYEWTGRAIERASGSTLEDFMRERIWKPLGIENDTSFWPKTKEGMKDRIADAGTLENGPPVVHTDNFDTLVGSKDCLGGAGVNTTAKAYYTFLSAVLRRDARLLKPSSYDELFRPQLDERCEQALNDYIALSPIHTNYLGMQVPPSVRKTWSFAGMLAKEPQEGRLVAGTALWGGFPSCAWFIDNETGICGTAICQVIPAMHPDIMALHERFHKAVFEQVKRK